MLTKRKSVIAITLAVLMLLSLCLTGCNSEKTGAGETSPDPNKEFTMAYLSIGMNVGWCVQVADAFEALGEKYNFNVEIADGNFSAETQLSQLDQYITMGVDAVAVMLVDPGSAEAIKDRCDEAGIILLGETVQFLDSNNKLITPTDYLNGYDVGSKQTQWIVDNYERLGFDYSDLSKVAFMYVTHTMFPEMAERVNGALDVWYNAFPDFPEGNVFAADIAADGGSPMEGGYNQAASIMTANPDFDYWVISAFQEDYASGVCRAIEDLNIVDNCLLVSAGGENVIPEWDNGLTKPWYAACYFTGYDSAILVTEAMIKLIREGASYDDIYPIKREGETVSYSMFSGYMITRDDYKELIRPNILPDDLPKF